MPLDSSNLGTQGLDPNKVLPGSASLYDFTPATRILTEQEKLEEELRQQSTYKPTPLDVHVVSEQKVKFPKHLHVFNYEQGNITEFRPAKTDQANKIGELMESLYSFVFVVFSFPRLLPHGRCFYPSCASFRSAPFLLCLGHVRSSWWKIVSYCAELASKSVTLLVDY
jgi:hypothetical protein